MHLIELFDDIFLNLLDHLSRGRVFGDVYPEPTFHKASRIRVRRVGKAGWTSACFGDEDDLKFTTVQVIPDDYLMAISLESLTCFWKEEVLVRFQLPR